MKKLLLLLGLLYSVMCQAQVQIQGKVISSDNQEEIIGANLYLVELRRGNLSQQHGKFYFSDLKKGTYTLQISHIGYKTYTQKIIFTLTLRYILSLRQVQFRSKKLLFLARQARRSLKKVLFLLRHSPKHNGYNRVVPTLSMQLVNSLACRKLPLALRCRSLLFVDWVLIE
jgi:hypothetical protein